MSRSCLMGTKSQFYKMKTFWRRTIVMAAQLCECTKHYWTDHLKMIKRVNFMLCVFDN